MSTWGRTDIKGPDVWHLTWQTIPLSSTPRSIWLSFETNQADSMIKHTDATPSNIRGHNRSTHLVDLLVRYVAREGACTATHQVP